ncbi:MAG: PAS domain S-box protein, partial [Chitinivibrionales bacterium]
MRSKKDSGVSKSIDPIKQNQILKKTEEDLRRKIAELEALNAFSRAVNSNIDMAQTAAAALQGMLDTIRPDLSFLFLREGERLILLDALPHSNRLGAMPEHRIGECICGLAVRESRPLFSRDIFNDPRCSWEECKKAGLKSFAALPLRSGKRIIGVIGLASDEERNFEEQASFLEILAAQVSIALSNALLFEAAQKELAERRRVEELLRESEERFRKIFEESRFGMVIVSTQFFFVRANAAFCAMLGYSETELSSLTFRDVTHPDHLARDVENVTRLSKGEIQVYKTDKRYIRKDGAAVWGSAIITAVRNNAGELLHFITMIDDITERKQAEAALKASEENFRVLFNENPLPTLLSEIPSGRITFVNRKLADLLKMDINEVLGKTANELRLLKNPGDQERLTGLIMAQGYVDNVEVERISPDGAAGANLISMRIITINEKTYCLSVLQDITERKRIEEAIAAEKERLAVTLRSIGDAVIATDVQGKIVLMNKVAETLTGWPLNDAVGKPLSDIFKVINELRRERLENPVEKVLSSGNIIELANHTLLVSRNGTERVIADSGAPIKDKNDAIIGVVLVFRDITEKQKFMDEIQRSAKLDSLGVLAGGIAHDFNNLLTGIFGYIDLARTVSKEAKTKEYLESTITAMNRARALTLQLLTFAKGGSPVQKITPLIPFILESAQFALSGSNVSCRFDVPEDLRPCNIDKDQIGQVIDNIVINAQQAMPSGGAIEISARNVSIGEKEHSPLAKGDYVKMSIKDKGIGIPKDIILRIFDPF